MGIQNLAQDIVFVTLSKEPQTGQELRGINDIVADEGGCDVVIDFCMVEIFSSASLNSLLILRRLQHEQRRQLILCNMAVPTKCIFTVAGLDTCFEFVSDKSAAIAALQHSG